MARCKMHASRENDAGSELIYIYIIRCQDRRSRLERNVENERLERSRVGIAIVSRPSVRKLCLGFASRSVAARRSEPANVISSRR